MLLFSCVKQQIEKFTLIKYFYYKKQKKQTFVLNCQLSCQSNQKLFLYATSIQPQFEILLCPPPPPHFNHIVFQVTLQYYKKRNGFNSKPKANI